MGGLSWRILRLIKQKRRAFVRYKILKTNSHLGKLFAVTHEYKLNIKSVEEQYAERLNARTKTRSRLLW